MRIFGLIDETDDSPGFPQRSHRTIGNSRRKGGSMNRLKRSPARLLAVSATILSLTALALAPSVSASSPRSGDLQATEDCSAYTGLAGSSCTIVSSNLKAIEIGSKVIGLQARGPDGLHSDLVLDVGPGNAAFGHVDNNPLIGPGVLTWSGGTGKFTHFHADVVISHDPINPHLWNWNGTYSFSPWIAFTPVLGSAE